MSWWFSYFRIPFVFDFWHFDYNVSWRRSLWVESIWRRLNFLNLDVCNSHNLGNLELLFCEIGFLFPIRSLSGTTVMWIFTKLVYNGLIAFLHSFHSYFLFLSFLSELFLQTCLQVQKFCLLKSVVEADLLVFFISLIYFFSSMISVWFFFMIPISLLNFSLKICIFLIWLNFLFSHVFLSFLSSLFWIPFQAFYRCPSLLSVLLESYWIPLEVSCYLSFPCFFCFYIYIV